MNENQRDYVRETLAQELDLRTPTASVSPAVNRILVQEFIEENEERVTEVVQEATTSEGELSPFVLTKRLLSSLEDHCRNRLRPEG